MGAPAKITMDIQRPRPPLRLRPKLRGCREREQAMTSEDEMRDSMAPRLAAVSTWRNARGFSLVELMVTVAILAVLAAAALPAFNDYFVKSRLRGAADDIVSLVATARGEAVKRGRDVTVAMGGTAVSWCMGANEAATPAPASPYQSSVACDCTSASACMVDGRRRVVNSTDYSGVTASAVTASVTIDGKLGSETTLATTSFNLNSAGNTYQVQVQITPLGQARVCVPSGQRAIAGYPSC